MMNVVLLPPSSEVRGASILDEPIAAYVVWARQPESNDVTFLNVANVASRRNDRQLRPLVRGVAPTPPSRIWVTDPRPPRSRGRELSTFARSLRLPVMRAG